MGLIRGVLLVLLLVLHVMRQFIDRRVWISGRFVNQLLEVVGSYLLSFGCLLCLSQLCRITIGLVIVYEEFHYQTGMTLSM